MNARSVRLAGIGKTSLAALMIASLSGAALLACSVDETLNPAPTGTGAAGGGGSGGAGGSGGTGATGGGSKVCGDGVWGPPEQCDDGNMMNGDGCENNCAFTCVKGTINGDLKCDDADPCNGSETCSEKHTCMPG